MSIYEVHLGSWRPGLSYRELADQLTDYVVEHGFTHVEFLPVTEHPFGGSWGYQVTSYYAPTARFGSPDDFRYLVDPLHQAGIGVILDWVPAHFPKDDWALARFDGTPLYEHADPRRGEQLDWGTYVFDFGRPEVRNFLVANALYWLQEFHVDGLRVDAVASMLYLDYSRPDGGWTPNVHGGRENLEAVQFLQEMNATVHKHPRHRHRSPRSRPPGRASPADQPWRPWLRDEVEHGLDARHPGVHQARPDPPQLPPPRDHLLAGLRVERELRAADQPRRGGARQGHAVEPDAGRRPHKAAGLRGLLAYMWAHPGKQLLFMGQEFGQRAEWSEERGLDWYQLDEQSFSTGVSNLVDRYQRRLPRRRALWTLDTSPAATRGSTPTTPRTTCSLPALRRRRLDVACVFNFSGSEHGQYRLGLPHPGTWIEILNTDADDLRRLGHGQPRSVEATAEPWHGRPASAVMALPPLAALWFEPEQLPREQTLIALFPRNKAIFLFSGSRQYSALARLRRPAMTSGSAGSKRSNTRPVGCGPSCARRRRCALPTRSAG